MYFSPKEKQLKMKSIFETGTYAETLTRMESLSPESKGLWGKMNVTQMMAHCQKPLEFGLEKLELKKPNFLMAFILKKFAKSLYDDKPWKQGMPTAGEYVITDTGEFQKEKQKLSDLITEFHNRKDSNKPFPYHPYFGEFTNEQWGKAIYKHMDHHLRQFGV